MRASEIEQWALTVIDAVKAIQPVESSRVELKAAWIDPIKAARRIAGHANAARGDGILWVIGVDESKRTVCGADPNEMAVWYPQVVSQFSGLPPHLTDVAIHVDGKTVVALYFDTDRGAPFLVKNPNFKRRYELNQANPTGAKADRIEYETPWREGTMIRTATHADLIRILVPVIRTPHAEVRYCELSLTSRRWTMVSSDQTRSPVKDLTWDLTTRIYLTAVSEERLIVLPFHHCKAEFEISGCIPITAFRRVELLPTDDLQKDVVRSSSTEMRIDYSGDVLLKAQLKIERLTDIEPIDCLDATAIIYLSLLPNRTERPILETIPLSFVSEEGKPNPLQRDKARWVFREESY